jgi:hypothetical protein
MQHEMQMAMMQGQQSITPYFVLRVSRERIVLDTLSQILLYEDTEFKKPLKVSLKVGVKVSVRASVRVTARVTLKDVVRDKTGSGY